MTLQDIILIARRDFLKDSQHPFRVSDLTLSYYAREAQREACRRSSLIVDNSELVLDSIPNLFCF